MRGSVKASGKTCVALSGAALETQTKSGGTQVGVNRMLADALTLAFTGFRVSPPAETSMFAFTGFELADGPKMEAICTTVVRCLTILDPYSNRRHWLNVMKLKRRNEFELLCNCLIVDWQQLVSPGHGRKPLCGT